MNQGSELLLSGLCFFDVDDILEVCTEQGLNSKTNNSAKNGAVCFWKNKF
jgi:ribosomal protein L11 methyltransferase